MLRPRSSLAVQHAERPVLAPLWLIALLAACTLVALVLLYPRHDLEALIWSAPDTELANNYLDNLLRSNPDSPRLHLISARRELRLNKLAAARKTLLPALAASDPEIQRDARWVMFEIAEAEYQANGKRNPGDRQTLARQLRTLLAEGSYPPEQSQQLAMKAFRYGAEDIGGQLLKQLGEAEPTTAGKVKVYDTAAQEALGQGAYRSAAECYLYARRYSPDPATARRYFHAALRALQSGNLLQAALELGEREMGDFRNDPSTLELMTQLSRAAGRRDLAEHYVRQLLRLSLLQQWQRYQMAQAWGPGQWQNVSEPAALKPGLPFNDRYYTLGYDVFIENGKLEDAFQLASIAVKQAPDDLQWRKRLATVAEWTSRPKIALDNWRLIAQRNNEEAAWQSVLRLAPGLFDDAALIPALKRELSQKPNDLRLIREIVAAYERLAEPQSALNFLDQITARRAPPEVLEIQAELAERSGNPDLAISVWQRRFGPEGILSPQQARHLAVLLLERNRGAEALTWLKRAMQHPEVQGAEGDEYWRLIGQMADQRQEDALAIQAFRRLTESAQAQPGDYESLARVITPSNPLDAAEIWLQAWRRFDEGRYLLEALGHYAAAQRWETMSRLFRELDPAAGAERRSLRKLSQNAQFMRLLGQTQLQTGKFAAAKRSLEAALQLEPNSDETRQALLWSLIDSHDSAGLRKLLATYEREWQKSPDLHESLASAYQYLSLPQVALQRYLTPQLPSRQDDLLWLMNYADALDQNQQSDRAWRLRRQLLLTEWGGVEGRTRSRQAARDEWLSDKGLIEMQRIARARLLLTQRPGDVALSALRELLRLDRDARSEGYSPSNEIAIGWLQDAAEYNAERGFLWLQYARSRYAHRALWAEITQALAEKDRAESGQLLLAYDAALPRYDYTNAAAAAHDIKLAQTAAFEAQNDQVDDNPTHFQLTENLLRYSEQAGAVLETQKLGEINERDTGARYHFAISPRLAMDFEWGRVERENTGLSLRQVPNEQYAAGQLEWQHLDGRTLLRLDRRTSLESYTPVKLVHELRIDDRLSFVGTLGLNQPAQETLPLRIAGMKDFASLQVTYKPTRSESVSLEYWRNRYQLQSGLSLGDSSHFRVTGIHLYRQERRDLELMAFWSAHRFNRREEALAEAMNDPHFASIIPENVEPAVNYLIPDSFNFYGLRIATDLRLETEYTRGIRPFGGITLTRHSLLGNGYDLRLGVAGSPLGADHFSLSWGAGKSGMQTNGLTRDMRLNYRIYY